MRLLSFLFLILTACRPGVPGGLSVTPRPVVLYAVCALEDVNPRVAGGAFNVQVNLE